MALDTTAAAPDDENVQSIILDRILALDLGWKWIGRILAPGQLPLAVRSDRLRMSPQDPWPVLARIMYDVRESQPSRVIIEHSPFFAPVGKSAAGLAKLAQMHEASSTMEEILHKALADDGYVRLRLSEPFPDPLPPRTAITIPRMTWAHRVRPHTQGGITDEMALEAMRPYVEEASWEQMASQDEIDACGAALWWLLPAQKRARKPTTRGGPPKPVMTADVRAVVEREQSKLRMRVKHGYLSLEERRARGCECGPRKHRAACHLAPPPRLRGDIAAAVARGHWIPPSTSSAALAAMGALLDVDPADLLSGRGRSG